VYGEARGEATERGKQMKRHEWNRPVTRNEAIRRAIGRERYNLQRRLYAEYRQIGIAEKLHQYGTMRGVQSLIAEQLHLDRATVCRDVAALRRAGFEHWDWSEIAARRIRVQRQIDRFSEVENARLERKAMRVEGQQRPDYF
jgi:hypothetical protein